MLAQKVYMNYVHPSTLLHQLSDLWKTEHLCDAVITVDKVIVAKAHKLLLFAVSPILKSESTKGSQSPILDVTLPTGIDHASVHAFLQYLYEGFLILTKSIAEDLTAIAKYLDIQCLLKWCEEFLTECRDGDSKVIISKDSKQKLLDDSSHVRCAQVKQPVIPKEQISKDQSDRPEKRKSRDIPRQFPPKERHNREAFKHVEIKQEVDEFENDSDVSDDCMIVDSGGAQGTNSLATAEQNNSLSASNFSGTPQQRPPPPPRNVPSASKTFPKPVYRQKESSFPSQSGGQVQDTSHKVMRTDSSQDVSSQRLEHESANQYPEQAGTKFQGTKSDVNVKREHDGSEDLTADQAEYYVQENLEYSQDSGDFSGDATYSEENSALYQSGQFLSPQGQASGYLDGADGTQFPSGSLQMPGSGEQGPNENLHSDNVMMQQNFENVISRGKHKSFGCRYCVKVFKTKPGLMRHINKHTGHYKHKCGICGKLYLTNLQFKEHMDYHNNPKSYHCSTCGRSYGYLRNFKSHKCRPQDSSYEDQEPTSLI